MQNGKYPSPDEVAFRVNYEPTTLKYITINGHLLARPHFTTYVSDFFLYLHKNPNRIVTKEEVETKCKIKLKKGIDDTLRDIGFQGVLAKIFFKRMTNNEVHFRNPVYWKDINSEISNEELEQIYRAIFSPKRKTALYPTS